jgi:hypothetical protein
MKIALMSLYEEVGTSFRLSHLVIKALRDRLREVLSSTEIQEFNDRFSGQDFSVGFVISATRKSDTLIVDGPILMKKPKGVDFVFRIPYKNLTEVHEKVDYVFGNVAEGIAAVMKKYGVPDPGVAQAVRAVADAVRENPKTFEYIPKHARDTESSTRRLS